MTPAARRPARGQRRPAPSPPARRPPRAARREVGGDRVEGQQAVRELLRARRREVRDVWVAEDRGEVPIVGEIVDLARRAKVPVRFVSDNQLRRESLTEVPQGVLAHAAPLPEAELTSLAAGKRALPFLVVLDGVVDPQNLGAVLRSAECAGATGIVLARHRAAHVTASAAKAAAGAIEHLPIAVVAGIPAALSELAGLGVWTVGLDPGAGTPLFGLRIATAPLALVLGAEGSGLKRLTRERCDQLVAIPLAGSLGSLNVGAAAAVACFEVLRQRSSIGT